MTYNESHDPDEDYNNAQGHAAAETEYRRKGRRAFQQPEEQHKGSPTPNYDVMNDYKGQTNMEEAMRISEERIKNETDPEKKRMFEQIRDFTIREKEHQKD